MDSENPIDLFFARYPPNTVSIRKSAAGTNLFLTGSLDLQYSRDLQNLLLWLVDKQDGLTAIIVDLEHVNYISSTGVGALAAAMISARKRDLPFKLRNIQPKVRSVFELLGLMKFFEEARTNE
ncbi:MAG: STAS domain-containing protein [Treponemataceae bacterium]